MALRGGENLFSREKMFSPPRTPPLSKKARYFCSRCSQSIFYKFIISLLAKRALHVCRTANASLCASNASRRIYPALHGLPTANHTSPNPFQKKRGIFARVARKAYFINSSYFKKKRGILPLRLSRHSSQSDGGLSRHSLLQQQCNYWKNIISPQWEQSIGKKTKLP